VVKEARPVGARFEREIDEVGTKLGIRRPVGAKIMPVNISPMVWFLGRRPLLLFGREILDADSDSRGAVVAHELAHICRGDHWVRLLEMLATVALWWHPLIWLARHRLREAEEEACDAWVVWAMPENKTAYADVLVEMARELAGIVPACASGLGGFGSLQRRLVMILQKTPKKSLGLSGWVVLCALAISLPLAVTGSNRVSAAPQAQSTMNSGAPDDLTNSAVKALLDATRDSDQQVAQAAQTSIATFGPKAVPVLIDGMKDPATLDMSRGLLANIGIDAVDPLIAALSGGDRAQRLNALSALGAISSRLNGYTVQVPGPPGFPQPTAVPAEIGPAAAPLPGFASPGFASSPGAPPVLAMVRWQPPQDPRAQGAMARIASAAAAATADPDREIRLRATTLLAIIADHSVGDEVIDRLIRMVGDNDAQVRVAAERALISLGPKAAKAVAALTAAASDRQIDVRAAAIEALGAIGPAAKDATPTLVDALKDSDPQIRMLAAQALGKLNGGGS
jgi:hypothetical protein